MQNHQLFKWSFAGFDSQITPEDKAAIRRLLLSGLDDPDSKLRTAIGLIIATIVIHDTPDDAKELLGWLVSAVNDGNNPNLVPGTVQCLKTIAVELPVDDSLAVRHYASLLCRDNSTVIWIFHGVAVFLVIEASSSSINQLCEKPCLQGCIL
jgi:hypothetical protein